MPRLDGTGQPVQLAPGYRLIAPGLRGTAETHPGRAPGTRRGGLEQATPALDEALRASDVDEVQLIELDVESTPPPRTAASVRTAAGEDGLVLEVPDLGESRGQLVLAVDEEGVITWNFPQDAMGRLQTPATRGAGGTKRFVIRRHVAATPPRDQARARGLVGLVGRKLLKVLVYPVTDRVLGPVGEFFAGRWEDSHRPYGVRWFRPDDYTRAGQPTLTSGDWRELSDHARASGRPGRALLFVHGTFSTAHGGFGSLPMATMVELQRAYDGRVLAFDHRTLSAGPQENVAWLLGQLPDGADLELDLVCHSRGGLVGRVLAGTGLDRFRVRRMVLVGTPNAGTALADPERMTQMVDRFTSVLNLAPPGPLEVVADTLEAIITAVKVIGRAALKGLPGLSAMAPGGDWLAKLNAATSELECYGVAADFEPKGSLRDLVRMGADLVLDRVFADQGNDLVVPTAGVFTAGDGFRVRADRTLVIDPRWAISHTHYFTHPKTSEKLLEWLHAS